VSDKPILFSTPMIHALSSGTKTQTRRMLKPQPRPDCVEVAQGDDPWEAFYEGPLARWGEPISVPWCVGDRLWVREAWRTKSPAYDDLAPGAMDADYDIAYEADIILRGGSSCPNGVRMGRYRNARFMPRWASRLTLIITNVRVQRLLDITEADAVAEGFSDGRIDDGFGPRPFGNDGWTIESGGGFASAAGFFQIAWSTLHTEWDGFSSPWVAALTFTVEHRNIDA